MFVNKEEMSLESPKQYKVNCPDKLSKIKAIKDKILGLGNRVGQTIIFVNTTNSLRALHDALVAGDYGLEVTNIQGAHTLYEMDKIIKEFKRGLTHVLISTDFLARGFDEAEVNLVVNYDLPVKCTAPLAPDYEVNLHRIGRAACFGRKGAVFNFLCSNSDAKLMEKIENHFNSQVDEVPSWNSEEDFEAALKKCWSLLKIVCYWEDILPTTCGFGYLVLLDIRLSGTLDVDISPQINQILDVGFGFKQNQFLDVGLGLNR